MKIQNNFSLKPNHDTRLKEQDEQLKQAAKMYESHFLNEMVRAMRSTVHREGGLMQPNMAEKIFSEQLDNQYVDQWSQKGGLGLADMIYTQLHQKMAGTKKDFSKPNGVIPIQPKTEPGGLKPTDSIQMKMIPSTKGAELRYRFEAPEGLGSSFDVLAPMPGQVKNVQSLGEGWNLVELDHGQGLRSELTFPGTAPQMSAGQEVQAGQKCGYLDSKSPVLAWKLEWG